VTIHGEDIFGGWVVDYAVCVRVGLGFAKRFQCLQVENHDFGGSAITDEAAAKLRSQRYAVLASESGNDTEAGAAVGVDDLDGGAAGEVDAPRSRVDSDVIEIFRIAAGRCAECIGLQEMVAAFGDREGKAASQKQGRE